MALNRYFDQNKANEQDLLANLGAETIQISGVDCKYIPRDSQIIDQVLQEDPFAAFNRNFEIEMYVDSFDGFDGQSNDMLSKFGITLNDEVQLVVSKHRFIAQAEGMARPLMGDLIYFPLSNTLFEINYVDTERVFYQIGDVPSFYITAEIFNYAGEDFDTGLDEVDLLDDVLSNEGAHDEQAKDNSLFDDANIIDFSEPSPWGSHIETNIIPTDVDNTFFSADNDTFTADTI